MNKFNLKLKEIRIEKGLTIKELANLLGISAITLNRYENNVTKPSLDTLFKLCVLFNVRLDYILGLSDDKTRIKPS